MTAVAYHPSIPRFGQADIVYSQDSVIQLLGLATYRMRFVDGRYIGKAADLFNSLNTRFNLVDLSVSEIEGWRKWYHLLRRFDPNRTRWLTAARMNIQAFRERSQQAELFLKAHQGHYDLIFQLHTMMSPGFNIGSRPFVLATDNTYRLSERHWPEWTPVKSDSEAWVKAETEIYQNAACIFTWSEFTRQSFIHDYGVAADKVIVSGISGNFNIEEHPCEPTDHPIALFVGFDFERKGGYVLLEAWKQVNKVLPNAELWIVGPRKPLADPIPGVVWKGRIEDRAELRKIFRSSSTFVLPSLFEPYGFALIEAMGFGLPCITVHGFGVSEVIDDGVTGLKVPPGEIQPLADAMIKLLGDQDTSCAMGAEALESAKTRFTWDAVINRMSPHIEHIVRDLRGRTQ